MKKRGGKFLGAAIGFSFGGPIGALLGAAIGYAVDEDSPGHPAGPGAGSSPGRVHGGENTAGFTRESAREIAYVRTLVLYLSGAARADGRLTPGKVETIRRFFRDQLGYRGARFGLVSRLVDESFREAVDLPRVCAAIAARTVYEERLYLVQLAFRVFVADGELSAPEEAYAGRAARFLEIGERDLAAIAGPFLRFRAGSASADGREAGPGRGAGFEPGLGAGVLPDPYEVLGVHPASSDEEVRRAYRSLANKYHPDKVLHLGQEFIDLANRKFTMISLAYEAVRRERGLA